MIKNIYTDKWGLVYAVVLWIIGSFGLSALCAGLIIMNTRLLILGGLSIFILRSDIVYFAKNHRVFLVTLILQIVCNSIFIGMAFYYTMVEPLIFSMLIVLVWCFSFYFYFYWLFYIKKDDKKQS